MADGQLSKLHSEAVAWRRARFDRLMRKDEYRAIFGRLLMTPPTRLMPVQDLRFMIEFAQAAADSDNA